MAIQQYAFLSVEKTEPMPIGISASAQSKHEEKIRHRTHREQKDNIRSNSDRQRFRRRSRRQGIGADRRLRANRCWQKIAQREARAALEDMGVPSSKIAALI
jgi:hypothetical protein